MAKAAAKAKAGTAPGAGGNVKRRGKRTWAKVLALLVLFPFAALLLPTTLVFATMMSPTWVAYVTDRTREKHLAITVGLLNFAGTLPAVIELWSRGQTHPVAMDLLADVFVWFVAYGAALVGWLIFGFMPNLVVSYFRITTQTRIKGLARRQKALVVDWGRGVAEGVATSSAEDGEEDDEGEASEDDDTEVTEAELVEPRPSRSGAR
jgi:hypothetical protein